MRETLSVSERFRELRERAGLTREEAANRMGVSPFHIETTDDDFTISYSAADVKRFCQILSARPGELFGANTTELPVSADELVSLIGAECRQRGITPEQFEDAVGWKLAQCMSPPERLLENMSLDGLQWLCRELGIHWHRVILAL